MDVDLSVPAPPGYDPTKSLEDQQQQQQPVNAQNGAGGAGTGTTSAIKRRAAIACRRCRRMRSKCQHDKGKPPCQACFDAGLGIEDCVFPVRGQPDEDREYRHPRIKAEKRDPLRVRREVLDVPVLARPRPPIPRVPASGEDEWDLLPPLEEIVEGVDMFTRHYFQLGFIHKQAFPAQLRASHRSVSVFFLLSLLSVSARLTPSLVARYGSAVAAANNFMEKASSLGLSELYKEPNLVRCQAFYLLSIAQQGSGEKHRSSINMGIAVRIASLMQLHREETYTLTAQTRSIIIEAESARRTLWMLHSQDNLHSGPRSPVSLSASDITTLLPCNEQDFLNAVVPKSRAALEGTPPAISNPQLVRLGDKSLFATLIQTHYYWGMISRRAISQDKSPRPWEPTSEYAKMERRLAEWEADLPAEHRWSKVLFSGHKCEGQDLAYLGVTMVTRLCNMIIRKAYLKEMITAHQLRDPGMVEFWQGMSTKLFANVKELFDQIDTQYKERTGDEGMGGQMAAFCIYSCGFLTCYLCKYPTLRADKSIVRNARTIIQRILQILEESKGIWPLATHWYEHLERFHKSRSAAPQVAEAEGSMADSREPIPPLLQQSPSRNFMASPERKQLKRATPHSSPETPQAPRPPVFIQCAPAPAPVPKPPSLPALSGLTALAVPPRSESGRNAAPLQSPDAIAPPMPLTQGPPSPVIFLDSNMRVGPPVGPPQTPSQSANKRSKQSPQQSMPPPPPPPPPQNLPQPQQGVAGQVLAVQAQQAMGARHQTDGLGLLIEAFDTHQAGTVVSPGVSNPYDPSGNPQDFFTPATLPTNDGYEHQLEYYITAGGHVPAAMGAWLGAPGLPGNMGGGIQPSMNGMFGY